MIRDPRGRRYEEPEPPWAAVLAWLALMVALLVLLVQALRAPLADSMPEPTVGVSAPLERQAPD